MEFINKNKIDYRNRVSKVNVDRFAERIKPFSKEEGFKKSRKIS